MSDSLQMPAESRVWIYQGEREYAPSELTELKQRVSEFTRKWTSHNKLVKAGFDVRYNRFLILYLDESHVSAGGCSIDSSLHFIKSLETEFNNVLTDRLKFAYKINDSIHVVSGTEFEKLLSAGSIDDDTLVFNNLVATRGELESNWEVPFKDSWHKKFFSLKV